MEKKRILILEPEPDSADLYAMALRLEGHEVQKYGLAREVPGKMVHEPYPSKVSERPDVALINVDQPENNDYAKCLQEQGVHVIRYSVDKEPNERKAEGLMGALELAEAGTLVSIVNESLSKRK